MTPDWVEGEAPETMAEDSGLEGGSWGVGNTKAADYDSYEMKRPKNVAYA